MVGKNISSAGSNSKIPMPDDSDSAYAMYLAEMGKIETEGFVPTIFLMLIYVFINNNLLE
jgi:hypothetical protein